MTELPLKADPKYGYFPWWPEDGDAWVHPEDVATARAMIPSNRVFCRDGMSGQYHVIRYGDITLRVRQKMWQEVEAEGLAIGDWVEVQTRGMRNAPRTGLIREMLWEEQAKELRYQLSEAGKPIEKLFAREDLKRVEPPKPSEPIVVREPAAGDSESELSV